MLKTAKDRQLMKPLIFLLATVSCARQDQDEHAHSAVKVTTLTVHKETIRDTRDFIGSLNSRRAVLLQSQVTGYISQIPVKAGDTVKKDRNRSRPVLALRAAEGVTG